MHQQPWQTATCHEVLASECGSASKSKPALEDRPPPTDHINQLVQCTSLLNHAKLIAVAKGKLPAEHTSVMNSIQGVNMQR